MDSQLIADVVIIGSGPAGLSAAVNCAARGLSCRLISNSKSLLAKTEKINNHLGFENVSGDEMMATFENHVKSLEIKTEKGKISNIMFFDGSFMLNFSGDIIQSKAVILAVGQSKSKAFNGEDDFLGRGVSYCATCDGMLFRGKKAVVVDLSGEAVEEANFLHSIGVETTFLSAKVKPNKLDDGIKYINGKVLTINGDKKVDSIEIESIKSKAKQTIETDVVFILRESIAPNTLYPDLEIENGYIKVTRNMETNIDGLFAAGDCTGWPLQISNAIGEGLIAAQQAAKYISKLKSKGE